MKAYLLAGLLAVGGCRSERMAFPLPAPLISFASKLIPADSVASANYRPRPIAVSALSALIKEPGNGGISRRKRVGYARSVLAPGSTAVAAANQSGRLVQTTRLANRKPAQPARPTDGNEYKYAILFLAIALLAGFGITLLVGVAAGSLATLLVGAIGLALTIPAALLADKIIYRKLHPSFRPY